MRCVLCDASDQGLSDYRPDGKFHAHKFTLWEGDFYCEECMNDIDDTVNEMFENDLDDEAFDYDD